jgi:fermentation-respiration switch protein FrsA (DUF1100 family)
MAHTQHEITTTPIEFQSRGTTCRGTLFRPATAPATGLPTVVMAGGWCYVKELVLPHYARSIAERGIAALTFDYRNFGESDGEPRLDIDPWEQIEDYRNALSCAAALPDVDPERLGAWGISYSGGHVLILAALDPRVRCVVSTIPVVEGHMNMRRVHGEVRFEELQSMIATDRERRYQGSAPGLIPMHVPDPSSELCTWPFADSDGVFAKLKADAAPRFENYSTIESVERLLAYTVFPYVERIVKTPTMMVLTENDMKTLLDLEVHAFNAIASPTKRCEILPALSHTSLYESSEHTRTAAAPAADWLAEHLAAATG